MSDGTNMGLIAARNRAIDEYFKCALTAVMLGQTTRQVDQLVETAMRIAIQAYEHRCQVLGVNFSKKI